MGGEFFRAIMASPIIGSADIATIARTATLKFCCTQGRFPKRKPAVKNPPIHIAAPNTLKVANLRYSMAPIPAMNGANVRTIGTNLASTTVNEAFKIPAATEFVERHMTLGILKLQLTSPSTKLLIVLLCLSNVFRFQKTICKHSAILATNRIVHGVA